jgi:hypothetical protein
VDKLEWKVLQSRIGIVAMFPFFQPELAQFVLDLRVYEDRCAATMAFSLAFKEGIINIEDKSLVYPSGAVHNFTTGISQSWAQIDELPAAGTFSFTYNCSADDRKMAARRDLARKYGGWNLEDDVIKHVVWWSNLETAPEAVLYFLYYCLKEFREVDAAFTVIDGGPGGNESVSLIEMKAAVAKWGWGRFKKNPDSVVQVFRFLDPDGGGEISRAEWSIMNQLFKELLLSIMEFMQFLDRFFGNFEAAWAELDSNGDNNIDEDEWGDAVQSIGFFGPSEVIFQYLTNDTAEDKKRRQSIMDITLAQRVITRSGWKKLQDIWNDRPNIHRQIKRTG